MHKLVFENSVFKPKSEKEIDDIYSKLSTYHDSLPQKEFITKVEFAGSVDDAYAVSYKRGYKLYKLLDLVLKNPGIRRKDIVYFIYEMRYGKGSGERDKPTGYWSVALQNYRRAGYFHSDKGKYTIEPNGEDKLEKLRQKFGPINETLGVFQPKKITKKDIDELLEVNWNPDYIKEITELDRNGSSLSNLHKYIIIKFENSKYIQDIEGSPVTESTISYTFLKSGYGFGLYNDKMFGHRPFKTSIYTNSIGQKYFKAADTIWYIDTIEGEGELLESVFQPKSKNEIDEIFWNITYEDYKNLVIDYLNQIDFYRSHLSKHDKDILEKFNEKESPFEAAKFILNKNFEPAGASSDGRLLVKPLNSGEAVEYKYYNDEYPRIAELSWDQELEDIEEGDEEIRAHFETDSGEQFYMDEIMRINI